MQWMHQSYKCMKAQQKKLSGCASNLLAHEDLGHFEEAHHWNIQAKFYNENSHQYMKVTKHETLYHEEHGATLKHKCGKRQQQLSLFLFFFSSFFLLFFFFWAFFFFGLSFFLRRGFIDLAFPPMGQCSNNDDHHTFITTRYYNSILEQSMTLYECLRRCTGICNESRVTSMKKL